MPLHPVRNRSLPDQVFDQIAAEIVMGRYAPGSALPAERALAELFGVNRHVVREALGRLEHANLVRISQGGRTRVLAFQEHAGLDLVAILSERLPDGASAASFWLSLLEMRAALAADVARLCAMRASREIREDLVALGEEMAGATAEATLFALDVRFWERVNDGAKNLAYRLTLNTMVRCSYALGEVGQRWSVYETRRSDFRRPIARAIFDGDAGLAEARTRQVMRAAVEAFTRRAREDGAILPPAAGPASALNDDRQTARSMKVAAR